MTESLISEAMERYDKGQLSESDQESMLFLLLQKNKRFATVMAFDMIFAGIDTVSACSCLNQKVITSLNIF